MRCPKCLKGIMVKIAETAGKITYQCNNCGHIEVHSKN